MKEGASVQLYTFWSDKQLFAIAAGAVKEVKDHSEITAITPICHAEEKVAGYINIRGEIYLALDFRKMTLNGGESPAKRDLIIFKESVGPAFGILVDHTGDIINVPPESLESWAEGPGANSAGSFNSSICKNGDKLISVLAPERFLLN